VDEPDYGRYVAFNGKLRAKPDRAPFHRPADFGYPFENQAIISYKNPQPPLLRRLPETARWIGAPGFRATLTRRRRPYWVKMIRENAARAGGALPRASAVCWQALCRVL
jgi:hypothetical protein